MAINQPSTTMIIDHHEAMDVPPSTNDSAPTSSGPPQNVIALTNHSANVSPKSQVINSSASDATDDPSDIMMARTPPATHEGITAYPCSESAGSPTLPSWANLADSGEYIPKEALQLEKDYGGFTLNSDFLTNQCEAPRRSSSNGRHEGRYSPGQGEWNARNLGATSTTIQNVCDTSDRAVLQLTKSVSMAKQIDCLTHSRMGPEAAATSVAKLAVGSSQNSAKKAICPIKPIFPLVTHRRMASGMSDSHYTPNCIPPPTSQIVQPTHPNNVATALPLVSHPDQANLPHSPTSTGPHYITVCIVAPSMLTAHIPCRHSGQTTANSYCPTVNHQKQNAVISPAQLPNSAAIAFSYACSSSAATYDSNGSRPSTLSFLGAWESSHIGPYSLPTTSNVHSYTAVQPNAHTFTSSCYLVPQKQGHGGDIVEGSAAHKLLHNRSGEESLRVKLMLSEADVARPNVAVMG
ncbi:hypothetical protein F0562_015304 [Nyssa sinensis]|uniref:Uncharacterized protein n=1 Tax=Nyssa sinensis TaxID=561372 RepID=A0A5J4ZL08_9ASTE|nr:hypothetical protein F0562_015304 [Nyssa sinensis]